MSVSGDVKEEKPLRTVYQYKGWTEVNIVLPSRLSRQEVAQILLQYATEYKRKADRMDRALEAIEKLAKENADVKWLLDWRIRDSIEVASKEHHAIAIDILTHVTKMLTAEELIPFFGTMFAFNRLFEEEEEDLDATIKKMLNISERRDEG